MDVSDAWVLDIIQNGYVIEFSHPPPASGVVSTFLPKREPRCSALLLGVEDLLAKRAISRVPFGERGRGVYSVIFLVQNLSGSFRTVINLKGVNRWVIPSWFRMVTLQEIIPLVKQGDWMSSVNLSDAYLHVPVRRSSQRFLRFAVEEEHFQFEVLPFG